VSAVKKLFSLRSALFEGLGVECCIFDTSPGIQYSSINAVVSSDLAVIVATMDSVDVEGVKSMLAEFYDLFEKKNALIVNKVFPEKRNWTAQPDEITISLEKIFEHRVLGWIPCYCDVLQADRSSILAVEDPEHPFVRKLEEVAKKLEHV
jgi:chromosome partitioning protein